ERVASSESTTSKRFVLPVISQDDINRFRNKKAVDELIPYFLCKILEWSCPDKLPDETFLKYLERRNISRRKFHEWELQRFSEESTPKNFDVALLYSLIKMAGYNLANSKDSVWKEKHSDKLESLLSNINDIRNGITHDVKTEAKSPEALDKIKVILDQTITAAGRVYSLPKEEVTEAKLLLQDKIKSLTQSLMTSKEKYLIKLQNKLQTEARYSLMDLCDKFCTGETLFLSYYKVRLPEVFSPVKLSMKGPEYVTQTKIVDQYQLLVNECCADPLNNIIILEGGVGSGKTALVKMLIYDFLNESTHKFENLNEFQFVYYICCRNNSIPTRQDFIRVTYPDLYPFARVEDLESVIFGSRNLFIFDGLDELNGDCVLIAQRFLERTSHTGKSTFLFVVRPFFTQHIYRRADLLGFRYRTFSMEKIHLEEEQVAFIQRYERVLKTKNSAMRGLTHAFKHVDLGLRPFFSRPMNLVLFCTLFEKSCAQTISKWSQESEVYHEVIELYKQMLCDRFRSRRIEHLDALVEAFMHEIYKLALRCLHKNKLSLTAEDCLDFKRKCFEALSRNPLPIDECLSTIFQYDGSYISSSEAFKTYTYQFIDRNFQEYMASKALVRFVQKGELTSMNNILENIIGEPVLRTDICKFRNAFAFATVDLVNDGETILLNKHIKDLSFLLEQTGQDEFAFWSTVLSKCNYQKDVVNQAAKVVEVGEWCVNSRTWMAAMHMLPTKQPRQINVEFREEEPIPFNLELFLTTVRDSHYKGGLKLDLWPSFRSAASVDHLLQSLQGSQCFLTRFTGCISTTGGYLLAPLLTKRSTLIMSLEQPVHHDLHLLPVQNLSILEVVIDYCEQPVLLNQERPLPDTELGVGLRNVPADAEEWVLRLLSALAPTTIGLDEIFLMRSGLTDDNLTVLTSQFPDAKRARVSADRTSADTNSWTVEGYYENDARDIHLRLGL
ncbi:P-loop containing nucleoside triphosphate hydrolase, partial [Trinorchestia longiramus]